MESKNLGIEIDQSNCRIPLEIFLSEGSNRCFKLGNNEIDEVKWNIFINHMIQNYRESNIFARCFITFQENEKVINFVSFINTGKVYFVYTNFIELFDNNSTYFHSIGPYTGYIYDLKIDPYYSDVGVHIAKTLENLFNLVNLDGDQNKLVEKIKQLISIYSGIVLNGFHPLNKQITEQKTFINDIILNNGKNNNFSKKVSLFDLFDEYKKLEEQDKFLFKILMESNNHFSVSNEVGYNAGINLYHNLKKNENPEEFKVLELSAPEVIRETLKRKRTELISPNNVEKSTPKKSKLESGNE